jgi:peptidoglycan/xylan/chitin deacetylase (PgdA/CDA1 family)
MNLKTKKERKGRLSPAEKIGSVALLLAALLLFFAPWLSILPLCLCLLLCLTAPFLPQFGFFLPIISRSVTGSKGVALTFDDGPSPSSTPIVLELLARYQLKATFFVIGEKASRHPDLIADILRQGHSIGNHSWQHDAVLMLRSRRRLQQDIHQTQEVLKQSGIQALVFRPPVGISNPRLKQVLDDENLLTVTFSCRVFDQGNRKIKNLARRILYKIKGGDILLLHDIAPEKEAMASYWKNELNTLFSSLHKGGYDVQPLERLIGRPVMIHTE